MTIRRNSRPKHSGTSASKPTEHNVVRTTDPRTPETRRASRAAWFLYFAPAILGSAADLVTKEAVFRHFGMPDEQPTWWLIQDRLGIQTALNPGALFGMAPGNRLIFAALSVAALVGIFVWLFVFQAARDRWLTVALGGITGGIIGNLYDRLGFWHLNRFPAGMDAEFRGAVRDWILFQWKEIPLDIFNPWPNFNIADSLLVCGAIMLAVHALTYREQKSTAAAGPSASSS